MDRLVDSYSCSVIQHTRHVCSSPYSPLSPSPSPPSDCKSPRRRKLLSKSAKNHDDDPLLGSTTFFNVEVGFKRLKELVPILHTDLPCNISKAGILRCSAEYCRRQRNDKIQLDKEVTQLKREIQFINYELNDFQNKLPSESQCLFSLLLRKDFNNWIRQRSFQNPKFVVIGLLLATLFDSFMASVSADSVDDTTRTLLEWQRNCLSISNLRKSSLSVLMSLASQSSSLEAELIERRDNGILDEKIVPKIQ